MPERFFLDTWFIQALLNNHDPNYLRAIAFVPRLRSAEVWITEAILVEVGNALSRINRSAAYLFVQDCYAAANMHVVSVDTPLLQQALTLYNARSDKTWGLTDCISFVVMRQQGLWDAVTADQHFVQAGYRALLLEDQ